MNADRGGFWIVVLYFIVIWLWLSSRTFGDEPLRVECFEKTSACYTSPCLVDPRGPIAWGTMKDVYKDLQLRSFQFHDLITGRIVAVDRHTCLVIGVGDHEWPPR